MKLSFNAPGKFYETGYINDVAIVKRYDDNLYKLQVHRCIKNGNVEIESKIKKDNNTIDNDEKLYRNMKRAKDKIFEYAYCNDWDYFFTGTVDKKKLDREDLRGLRTKLVRYVQDIKKHK